MRTTDLLLRALYFCLLLLGTAASLQMPSRVVAPGAVFVILSVYAHAAARILGVTGSGKALLFLETLPFFGFGCVYLGRLEPSQALPVLAAGATAGAAILAGEHLAMKGTATFTTSLGFLMACGLAGWGLATLPVMVCLGLFLVTLTVAGYGVIRRVRG